MQTLSTHHDRRSVAICCSRGQISTLRTQLGQPRCRDPQKHQCRDHKKPQCLHSKNPIAATRKTPMPTLENPIATTQKTPMPALENPIACTPDVAAAQCLAYTLEFRKLISGIAPGATLICARRRCTPGVPRPRTLVRTDGCTRFSRARARRLSVDTPPRALDTPPLAECPRRPRCMGSSRVSPVGYR